MQQKNWQPFYTHSLADPFSSRCPSTAFVFVCFWDARFDIIWFLPYLLCQTSAVWEQNAVRLSARESLGLFCACASPGQQKEDTEIRVDICDKAHYHDSWRSKLTQLPPSSLECQWLSKLLSPTCPVWLRYPSLWSYCLMFACKASGANLRLVRVVIRWWEHPAQESVGRLDWLSVAWCCCETMLD